MTKKALSGTAIGGEKTLFSVTPTGYFSVPIEIDHPNFGPVSKIKRNESFAHIKMVHPGLSVAGSLDVVGLAVEGDNLFFGHPYLRVLLRLFLRRLGFGSAVGGRATGKDQSKSQR